MFRAQIEEFQAHFETQETWEVPGLPTTHFQGHSPKPARPKSSMKQPNTK